MLFVGITALPYLFTLIFKFGVLLVERGQFHGSAPNLASPGMLGGLIAGAFGGGLLSLLMMGLAQAATVSAVSDLC